MATIVKLEPAYIIATIVAFLEAFFGVAVAFGFDLSVEQRTAIIASIAPCVGLTFLLGHIIRQQVTPVAKAQEKIDRAFLADPAVDQKPTLDA